MAHDEEAVRPLPRVSTMEHLHRHSFAHFWHREAGKRELYGPDSEADELARARGVKALIKNAAITEFGPALVDRMDAARKKQTDLYNDPVAFYSTFHKLMRQFEPRVPTKDVDATAGAVGYIVYLWKTIGEVPVWKMRTSEAPIAQIILDQDFLSQDYEQFKREEGQQDYHLRWIHLPGNNMEWVEHCMHRIIETLVKKTKGDATQVSPEDVHHVVHHVLHPKRWTARQNDRSPEMVHARYMDSTAAQFTVASKTSAPQFEAMKKRSFVLFMPFLSWERSTVVMYRNMVYEQARQKAEELSIYKDGRIRVDSNVAAEITTGIPCCEREALLRNYLFTKHPMHLRRTLDQSYFTVMEDTAARDQDQVVERHAHKQTHWPLRDRIDPPIIMVDHLWLWVLNKDTVLTCFPRAWGHQNEYDHSDLFELMQERILRKCNELDMKPGKVRMGRLISETCAMYLRKMSKTAKALQFMRFFDESMKKVKDEKARFHRAMSSIIRSDRPNYDAAFLDITREFKVLGDLMDIMDEIQMILHVIDEQFEIMTKLDKDLVRTRHLQPDAAPDAAQQPQTSKEWRVLNKIQRERNSWATLLAKAEETRAEVKELVDMKQQHASIKLAIDTSDQSNSVMLFTVVTILFLPLSTIASIFGVNALEFGSGALSLRLIFSYMFPLSVLIIALTVWLAFSHSARNCLVLGMEVFVARIMLYIPTGIFDSTAHRLLVHLQDLKRRRRVKYETRMERKRREAQEVEEREKMEEEKRENARLNGTAVYASGIRTRQLSRISTDEDDEFEEDSNVDVEEDGDAEGSVVSEATQTGERRKSRTQSIRERFGSIKETQ